MKKRAKYALAFIAVILTALTTYRCAVATDGDATGQVTVIMNGLGNRPLWWHSSLAVATASIELFWSTRPSLNSAEKRFLGGTVTDKYPEINVAFPGTVAYVALDRIAYIQYLDGAKPKDGK